MKIAVALILSIASLISSIYIFKVGISYKHRVVGMVIHKYYDFDKNEFILVLNDNMIHQVYPQDFMKHNLGETFDKTYNSLEGFPLFVLSAILMIISISLFITVIDLIKNPSYYET